MLFFFVTSRPVSKFFCCERLRCTSFPFTCTDTTMLDVNRQVFFGGTRCVALRTYNRHRCVDFRPIKTCDFDEKTVQNFRGKGDLGFQFLPAIILYWLRSEKSKIYLESFKNRSKLPSKVRKSKFFLRPEKSQTKIKFFRHRV